jgi:hypothetical protein
MSQFNVKQCKLPFAGIIQIRFKGLTRYGGALSLATPSSPSKLQGLYYDYNVLHPTLYIRLDIRGPIRNTYFTCYVLASQNA